MIKSSHLTSTAVAAFCLTAFIGGDALSQSTSDTLDALVDSRQIPVNVDNFIRATTDVEFAKYVSLVGGVNAFYHFRTAPPIDNQPTIRMNRDTFYSIAVIDISEGATLNLPDVGDRYLSVQVVNQDHYTNTVFHGGGTHKLDMETFDTPYVMVLIRTLVNASDPDDVAAVNAFQDGMIIDAAASRPFISPDYDEKSLEVMISEVLRLAQFGPDALRTFGPKSEIDAVRHFLGTAIGWGGLPESEAFYAGVEPALPVGAYKIEVPAEVPVGAFWSISLYNSAGFFQENAFSAYSVNSITGARNADSSMTVHFGDCEDERLNCLPIMENWNYTVRLYQPGPEVIDGSWSFPAVQPAN